MEEGTATTEDFKKKKEKIIQKLQFLLAICLLWDPTHLITVNENGSKRKDALLQQVVEHQQRQPAGFHVKNQVTQDIFAKLGLRPVREGALTTEHLGPETICVEKCSQAYMSAKQRIFRPYII